MSDKVLVSALDYTGSSMFCPTHCHSIYSVLDGVASPSQYATELSARKWPGMAITEHGHMGSMPDFVSELGALGMKAISGCEIYFNDFEPERRLFTGKIRDLKESDPERYFSYMRNRHLTVLAKNQVGLSNLIKLTTQAYKTGFYYKPRIWFDKLCEYKEGLIVLSGCLNGPVAHELRRVDADGQLRPRIKTKDGRGAFDWLKKFKDVFGEDFYGELQMPRIENDEPVFRAIVEMCDILKIKLALANDTHYIKRVDYNLQKVMMAIDQNTTVDSPDLFHVNSDHQYLKTRAELWETFRNNGYSNGIPDSVFEAMCDNTLEIFEKCQKQKMDPTPKIPTFQDADKELISRTVKSMREKGHHKIDKRYNIDGRSVTHSEQLHIELERIIDKGYSSYFLITSSMLNHGLKRGYRFSPRGSAPGSYVNHLLGISPINSVKWQLSFDRFLSPSRGGFLLNVNMPESSKIQPGAS